MKIILLALVISLTGCIAPTKVIKYSSGKEVTIIDERGKFWSGFFGSVTQIIIKGVVDSRVRNYK